MNLNPDIDLSGCSRNFWAVPLVALLVHAVSVLVVVATPTWFGPGTDHGWGLVGYGLTLCLSVGSGVVTPLFWYVRPAPPRAEVAAVTAIALAAILAPIALLLVVCLHFPSR